MIVTINEKGCNVLKETLSFCSHNTQRSLRLDNNGKLLFNDTFNIVLIKMKNNYMFTGIQPKDFVCFMETAYPLQNVRTILSI